MLGLSATRLIDVWEGLSQASPAERAEAILAAAWPEFSRDAVAELPIGARDRLLLAARAATFGRMLDGRAHCPRCGGEIELLFDIAEALAVPAGSSEVMLEAGGQRLTLRPAATRDVTALVEAGLEGPEAARFLISRCVLQGRIDALDDAEIEAVGDALVAADPGAEIVLTADCPDCGTAAELTLDPLGALWPEIEARVQGLLTAVARLAGAFGWREADILALSETRRRAYLALGPL